MKETKKAGTNLTRCPLSGEGGGGGGREVSLFFLILTTEIHTVN